MIMKRPSFVGEKFRYWEFYKTNVRLLESRRSFFRRTNVNSTTCISGFRDTLTEILRFEVFRVLTIVGERLM